MILDDILKRRREQLAREKARVSPEEMKALALSCSRPPLDFKKAISEKGINIISEVKKASPSKGIIADDFRPSEIAVKYEKNGAAAISVLTEEHYFMGSGEYLKEIRKNVSVPLLRKDFIFDSYQIYEARALGADAVLLIAAMLTAEEMKRLMAIAGDLGLSCLCESHNEAELKICKAAGADIFGINNRDLKTFRVDLAVTEKLAALVPKEGVIVSESGMLSADDVLRVMKSGAKAALIGESLMRDPALLASIREGAL